MVRSVPLLERPRLVESLLDARVVLLVAPPGSGKTVLLDQWEQSLREKAHVVRVTMTFEHNDPLAFQAAIFPATAMALSADLANPDEVLPSSIPAFIDAVWNHPEPRRPTVFIFDQYECISETIISDAILSAFRMLPDDTVLVFSSRTAPNILVSDFYGRGEVVELGANDLRLTRDELAMLAAQVSPPFTALEIDHIARESLGWLAAARLLLQGDERGLGKYIDEEVLSGLNGQIRRLTEDAAAAVTISDEQAEILFGVDAEGHPADHIEYRGVLLPLLREPGGSGWQFPPVLRRRLLDQMRARDADRSIVTGGDAMDDVHTTILTKGENDILARLHAGDTMAQIAEALGVTFQGARAQVRELYDKLGASTRESALQRAGAIGILEAVGKEHAE